MVWLKKSIQLCPSGILSFLNVGAEEIGMIVQKILTDLTDTGLL